MIVPGQRPPLLPERFAADHRPCLGCCPDAYAAAAMPLDELEPWLTARAKQHPPATSVPMLDGYVAAIVAGPLSTSPLDWICPLLAIDADAFNHRGTRSSPRFRPSRCATTTSVTFFPSHHIGSRRSMAASRMATLRAAVVPGIPCRHAAETIGLGPAARHQQHTPRLARSKRLATQATVFFNTICCWHPTLEPTQFRLPILIGDLQTV